MGVFDIGGLAQGAASQVVGAGLGLMLEKHNDARQLRQNQRLQEQQIAGQKEMSDYNYSKQLQMWHDTNYAAQMQELSKAGLNPGLMYGMGGGGGVTTGSGSGGSVSPQDAPKGGNEVQMQQMQQMQMGLMLAQKNNIDADTENKKADTKLKGTTGTKTEAETQSILQGITNQKAQQEVLQADARLKNLEANFNERSMENRLTQENYLASKLDEEIKMIERNNQIGDAVKPDTISMLKANAAQAWAEKWLTDQKKQNLISEQEYTKAMTKNTAEEWHNIILERTTMKQHADAATKNASSLDTLTNWQTSGMPAGFAEVANSIMSIMTKAGGGAGHTPITGFHKR